MRYIFFLILLGGFAKLSLAQVEVSLAFERDTAIIGDEVDFVLSVAINDDAEILAVASYFLDSIYGALQSAKMQTDTSQPLIPQIADFELISNAGWIDRDEDGYFSNDELDWTANTSGTQRLLEQRFTVKLWDPGITIIPYPVVVYNSGGSQDVTTSAGRASIFIAPPRNLPAEKDSLDLAPIKNIKEEPVKLSDYMAYFVFIGIAILLGLLYWLYSRYTKNLKAEESEKAEEIPYVPPHTIAISKLSELEEKQLWQLGKIKMYQSELTRIIREYLEGRYEIAALESTTDEIVTQLISEIKNEKDVVSLKRILQVADLVKFAKARPDENVHQAFMDEAVDFVNRTKLEETSEDSDD